MIKEDFKPYVFGNFERTYKDYLINNVFGEKKTYNEQFKNKDVQKALEQAISSYFDTLYDFYVKYPKGTLEDQQRYFDTNEALKKEFQKYFKNSNGDENLYGFLRIYGYCLEQISNLLIKNNRFVDDNARAGYLDLINRTATSMYKMVKMDLISGNYWWIKDSATTLRRQLCEKFVVIADDRLQNMLDKYFPRKINVRSLDKLDKNDLVRELDLAMYRKYHTLPYYLWWGKGDGEKKKLKMGPEPPKTGEYAFIVYQNYTAEEVKKEDKQYYL